MDDISVIVSNPDAITVIATSENSYDVTVEGQPEITTEIKQGMGIQGETGPQGEQGEIGPQGIQGEKGNDGAGDKTYAHQQDLASDTWVAVHNLEKYPCVTIVDSGGTTVGGTVRYDSINQVTITFNAPFSGDAYFN